MKLSETKEYRGEDTPREPLQPDDMYRVVKMKSGAYKIQERHYEFLMGEKYWKTMEGHSYVTLSGAVSARQTLVSRLEHRLADDTVDQVIDHSKVAIKH